MKKKTLEQFRTDVATRTAQHAPAPIPDETPVQLIHAHDNTRCYLRIEPAGTHVIAMTEQQYEAAIAEMQKVLASFRARTPASSPH